MMKAKTLTYITALFLLIAAAEAAKGIEDPLYASGIAQVVSITTDAGDTYEVPEGYYVYIAQPPVFGMVASANGDMMFSRLSDIEGAASNDEFVPFNPNPAAEVEPECKSDGPLVWVEGQGWTFCNGDGWILNGEKFDLATSAYNEASADFRSQIGAYEKYSGSRLSTLKALLAGNSWWQLRLNTYAQDIMAGNVERFYRDFRGSTTGAYALEVVNRYIALLMDGYTVQEIYGYVWGGE